MVAFDLNDPLAFCGPHRHISNILLQNCFCFRLDTDFWLLLIDLSCPILWPYTSTRAEGSFTASIGPAITGFCSGEVKFKAC